MFWPKIIFIGTLRNETFAAKSYGKLIFWFFFPKFATLSFAKKSKISFAKVSRRKLQKSRENLFLVKCHVSIKMKRKMILRKINTFKFHKIILKFRVSEVDFWMLFDLGNFFPPKVPFFANMDVVH